jgi:hypothetical protein
MAWLPDGLTSNCVKPSVLSLLTRTRTPADTLPTSQKAPLLYTLRTKIPCTFLFLDRNSTALPPCGKGLLRA